MTRDIVVASFAECSLRYFVVVVGCVSPAGPGVAPALGVFAVVVGVLVVGVAVEAVGVLVVGLLAVGVLVVGVVGAVVGAGVLLVPVAGSVFCGFVVVRTCSASSETATNAAATPPSASTKTTVTMMIGIFQLPGRRMRVVAL